MMKRPLSVVWALTVMMLVAISSLSLLTEWGLSTLTMTTARQLTVSSSMVFTMQEEEHEVPTLFPLLPLDYVGFACTVLGLVLAAGAGIGGGGILVPIYILIFGFCVKHSIPLASVTVLGGAIANNILNAKKSHPEHPSRPAIDWDLILQLEPMTMAGALIGADLNDFLPEVLLVVMLFVLLSLTALKTLKKAWQLYQKEEDEQEQLPLLVEAVYPDEKETSRNETAARLLAKGQSQTADIATSSSYGTLSSSSNGDDEEPGKKNGRGKHEESSSAQRRNYFLETDHPPSTYSFGADKTQVSVTSAIAKLTSLFLVITFLNIVKGGPGEGGPLPEALTVDACGQTCFWTTELLMLLIILLFAVHTRWTILKRMDASNDGGAAILSEIEWNEENTILYPMYAIVAGLVAGLFGIGGGIIKGPLMLALGVHPAVASATSACMILFTSCVATVSYVMFDLLIYDYATGCLVIGFLSTLVGQTIMSLLMARYKRHSYIAFTIGLVVGISAIAMTIEAVIAMQNARI